MATQIGKKKVGAARRARRQRGMTLIEIMVVITILGLIAAAVGVAVIPKLGEAKQNVARQDVKRIVDAANLYKVQKGKYPESGPGGIKALVDSQNLDKEPLDPWGAPYMYMLESGKPVVYTYGGDGQQGGDGEDADVSSKDTGRRQE